MRVADVLRRKGSTVATVGPDVTVTELIGELAAHNVGALPVVAGGKLTTCSPGDDVGDLAAVMTSRRFRHLPVVVDGTLTGIVSIGDLVKARIDLLESERAQLQNYIAGS
jgi:CBS domain-containing protein